MAFWTLMFGIFYGAGLLLGYCFGESEGSIPTEIERDGASKAVERVREHIAAERCACELRTPRGSCCVGDVSAAVKRVETFILSASTER